MPRVVIGTLLFNHADHFPQAIESILGQTFTEFAVVLVDDQSTDRTPELARDYAARDPRVTYHRNHTRLGLTGNAREAFMLARRLHPGADYFAWTTDHDVWHPEWLGKLVEALDRNPHVAVAYPQNRRIGPSGEPLRRKPWSFDTAGITSRGKRLRRAILHMRAGNMVYGLYRPDLLQRAGIYRDVLVPDRLLFAELSLYGQFRQVPEVLWFRRWYGREFSLGRQASSFFLEGRPARTYAPWWIAHAASLFGTLTLRGDGAPQVSRAAGAWIAVQYALIAGPLHAWQSMRDARGRLTDRSRGMRRTALRARRSLSRLAFEAMRRPALAMLRTARAIPAVRSHVVRPLLKPELDEIPASAAAREVDEELARLRRGTAPILIGPWVGEVGFELLYWIPFLNWALGTHGLEQRRLIVVSRGGARPWYRHLTSEYVDVFDLFTLEEYREANEARWDRAGHQKQYRVEQMDLDILARARQQLGLPQAELLHPSLMYRLLRYYWFDKAGIALLKRHTTYRRFAPPEPGDVLKRLPERYVAARFYFRPSFPDTAENRRFAADVVSAIARDMPVVLLNTGHKPDEHEDLAVTGRSVYCVDDLMTLERNLEVQTAIVSRAHAFVGTYGGLAYLGPFYGVPSVSFYSDEQELVASHVDVSWRVGQQFGVKSSVLHTRFAPVLRALLNAVAETRSAVGS